MIGGSNVSIEKQKEATAATTTLKNNKNLNE